MPCLCGCCGGAVDLIIPVFTLHRSDFSLGFETLYDIIGRMVADLWQRKGKISGCFKSSTPIVPKQCQNELSFQSRVLATYQDFAESFKGLAVLSIAIRA